VGGGFGGGWHVGGGGGSAAHTSDALLNSRNNIIINLSGDDKTIKRVKSVFDSVDSIISSALKKPK
jgi:hypothetical protein